MRRCGACGAENLSEAVFCGSCGSQLDPPCATCGSAWVAGQRFCIKCGAPRAQTSARDVAAGAGAGVAPPAPGGAGPPAPATSVLPSAVPSTAVPLVSAGGRAPGAPAASDVPGRQVHAGGPGQRDDEPGYERAVAERRVCSVLFVDLVGFTSLAENRDPEDVREILSRYFRAARELINRYGGVVEKFIGDAVMAVWGTPVAEEGDAERAVRAALEVIDAVSLLGSEIGAEGLAGRAGVFTGEVAVTLGTVGEGMVAGDAVNTASRVQSVAAPGTVLCDEATRKLSERAIGFEAAGTFALKGKENPEDLFRAVRVLSGVGGKQRADGLEAPFTGRDLELRTLKDLFNTSVDRRSPRLVVISGPAGVGKSRLGWEFEKYIDGIVDTVLWHRGRCLSYGEGIAFWALAQIVRQRFGIAEEDPIESAAAKLHEGMVRYVPDATEREYIGVRLSRLLGVPYESKSNVVLSQDELYAGWRLLFERLAQVAPVVLVVEDAQHADESLLGFFEHLIDWTRDLPIFVLLFARPGLEAIDTGYAVGRNRSTLSLDPLDDASMTTLIDSLVPGMPAAATDAITARAQGIPLFAVETIRSLIDQEVVRRDEGTYRLVGEIGRLSVPDSLHALLAARLDALVPDVRSLVADASVLGTAFPKEALVATSGRDEDTVAAALAELVKRDVLHVIADPLSPERGSYRFGQEMLRQVAYETLSKKDRKSRHLAVAAHLRATFANDGEEIADAIARHYLDALAAGSHDADADETAAKALGFLIRAAERAERSGALARAGETFEEAAAIAPDEQAAALFERAAQVRDKDGDFDAAIADAEAAQDRHLKVGDARGAARAQSRKGNALRHAGRFSAARTELAEALGVLRPHPDRDTVQAIANLASLETFGGDLAEGRSLITEALRLGQALDVSDSDMALLMNGAGNSFGYANRIVESAAYYGAAVQLAEAAGDTGLLALTQLNLSSLLATKDPRGAIEAGRSAAAHARRTGRRDTLSYALSNLVVAQVELGEWAEADEVVRQALEVEHLERDMVHYVAGLLAGLRGNAPAARRFLDSMPGLRESEELQAQAAVATVDAILALAEGSVADALDRAMAVLEKREQIGIGHEAERFAWPLAARAARSLKNHEVLTRLVAMLDEHPVGHLPSILRAERELVRSLAAANDRVPGAVAAVREAIAVLRLVENPYQLAHGLVDYAEVLMGTAEEGAQEALAEAREIARRLGCPPLAARADGVEAMQAALETTRQA